MRVLEGSSFVTPWSVEDAVVDGTLRCRPLIGRHNGAVAISMRALEFGPGISPRLRALGWDDVWYVLEGHGELWLDHECYAIGPDTGIHLGAGRSAWVDNPNAAALRIVSVRCPDPGTDLHASAEPPGRKRAGRGPRPLVHLLEREAETTGDRWYRVLVDPRLGCDAVTQFVGSIPPGRAPDHFHEYEEVLCILEGRGRMWAGTTHAEISPGSCVYLPRRQVHCLENHGPEALRLLGVFYPAGSPADRGDDATT